MAFGRWTSPACGGAAPPSTRSSVVLPAPLRPTSPTLSPGAHLEVDAVDDRLAADLDGEVSGGQHTRKLLGERVDISVSHARVRDPSSFHAAASLPPRRPSHAARTSPRLLALAPLADEEGDALTLGDPVGVSASSIAETCMKRSGPPSRAMKPNPRRRSNHVNVPTDTRVGRRSAELGVLACRDGRERSEVGCVDADGQPQRSSGASAAGRCWSLERSDTTSARRAGAGGAARAVDVVLLVGGRIEVHDAGDVVDVDAAGGDVGRDERLDRAVRERRERPVALALRPPPWIAAARTPAGSSCLARRSAPCFVRQNTIVGPRGLDDLGGTCTRASCSTIARSRWCERAVVGLRGRPRGAPGRAGSAGRARRSRRRAWPRTATSGGRRGVWSSRRGPRAGSPCRPCGRPRR